MEKDKELERKVEELTKKVNLIIKALYGDKFNEVEKDIEEELYLPTVDKVKRIEKFLELDLKLPKLSDVKIERV